MYSSGRRTRQLSTRGAQCPALGCAGELLQEVTSRDVHLQLTYYKSLFDVVRASELISEENKRRAKQSEPLPPIIMPTLADTEQKVTNIHIYILLIISFFHLMITCTCSYIMVCTVIWCVCISMGL